MRCSKCEADKEETEFHTRKDRLRGRHSQCKECRSNKDLPWNDKQYKYAITQKSNRKLRRDVLEHYSNGLLKCGCCGESQYRFLTLDHVGGGGGVHRRSLKTGAGGVYRDIRQRDYPEGFQVLCYNCNCGRAHNNGVCPHEEI